MSLKYKTSYRVYSAWNYGKEIEDLNRASEQGWQLVKGGSFHSRFVKNPDVRYRYQLDYGKVENMGLYIETFREQGWEYVNSTFNGWHYFRKLYDPALPEEAYEIYTDRESLSEMNNRWARLALILGAIVGVLAVVCAVRLIMKPTLPTLVLTLAFAVISAFLIRGWLIMRNPEGSRSRRGDGAFLAVFFAVIIVGGVSAVILTGMRPALTIQSSFDRINDENWGYFEVRYRDNYYLDLEVEADAPLTFKIVNAAGETVFSETGRNVSKEDIRLELAGGQYTVSLACDAPYELKLAIE